MEKNNGFEFVKKAFVKNGLQEKIEDLKRLSVIDNKFSIAFRYIILATSLIFIGLITIFEYKYNMSGIFLGMYITYFGYSLAMENNRFLNITNDLYKELSELNEIDSIQKLNTLSDYLEKYSRKYNACPCVTNLKIIESLNDLSASINHFKKQQLNERELHELIELFDLDFIYPEERAAIFEKYLTQNSDESWGVDFNVAILMLQDIEKIIDEEKKRSVVAKMLKNKGMFEKAYQKILK